jgi:hypothetical protein
MASYPTKTAIFKPVILAHTLLVTLGKGHSPVIITVLSILKIKHIFKNFLKQVIKKCACDTKHRSHQNLKAFI